MRGLTRQLFVYNHVHDRKCAFSYEEVNFDFSSKYYDQKLTLFNTIRMTKRYQLLL